MYKDIQVEAYRLKCNALDSLSVCPLKLPLSACLSMIKSSLKPLDPNLRKIKIGCFERLKCLFYLAMIKRQKMEISLCNLGYKCWIVIYYILKLKSIICCDISVKNYWVIFRQLLIIIWWYLMSKLLLSKILKWLDQITLHYEYPHILQTLIKSQIPKNAKFQPKYFHSS